MKQGMSAEACTCGELRKAARAITLLYDNAFKSSGLLSTQLGVLDAICNADSIKISDFAEKQGMDRTTLTRNLAVLERQGFIKISSGKDQRTRIVTTTQKGRNAVANAIPLWNDVQRTVKQQMGENSWRELMQNLSHFVRVADQLNDRN
ncbi:MAG TPA: MarR family winged helix-turn-helix transcriptional regulator [Nitrososphaeraceae archaeon]